MCSYLSGLQAVPPRYAWPRHLSPRIQCTRCPAAPVAACAAMAQSDGASVHACDGLAGHREEHLPICLVRALSYKTDKAST